MSAETEFEIIYAPAVKEHVAVVEPKYYSLIREAIQKRLRFEPGVETKNRKPLKQPGIMGGAWEIRFGPGNRFRVFYTVDSQKSQVHVLALGEKKGNRLWVGKTEIT